MPPSENHGRPRVLITDASERSMVAVCRGLRAGGYAVSAGAFAPLAAGQWSRCCSERLRLVDPRVDVAGFIADLRRCLEDRRCAVLIPGSDYSLLAVSRERGALARLTRLGLPPHEVVKRCFDREVLAEAAESSGLAPALAVRCVSASQAAEAAREVGYPVLLKSISTVRDLGAAVAAGPDTRRLGDEAQLRAVCGDYGDAWLVQRCVTGRTLSFGGVIAGGRLLAAAVSEYRRTWPPTAGNVSFSSTIEPPPGLSDRVAALLCHVGWEGMFELELIEERTGAITPIDLNPRPYGSMALAVGAGANLPALWCDWLLDNDPGASPSTLSAGAGRSRAGLAPRAERRGHRPTVHATQGRTYRWEDADLRHLAWQLRHGNYAAAGQVMRTARGTVHPHFRVSDPLPLFVRAASLAAGKIQARAVAGRPPRAALERLAVSGRRAFP
jgi:predicted ATP-grasp superfamily ATP-dependent carboligase